MFSRITVLAKISLSAFVVFSVLAYSSFTDDNHRPFRESVTANPSPGASPYQRPIRIPSAYDDETGKLRPSSGMLVLAVAFSRAFRDDPEVDGWLYVLAAMGSLWVAGSNWQRKPTADQPVA
jgi:hypothetical protein